jgi:hypothetical protein
VGLVQVTPVCLFISIFYPYYKLCDNNAHINFRHVVWDFDPCGDVGFDMAPSL